MNAPISLKPSESEMKSLIWAIDNVLLAMSQEKLGAALGLTFQQVQPHRGEPVAANVPYPAGASSVLLRGRAERISAPWLTAR